MIAIARYLLFFLFIYSCNTPQKDNSSIISDRDYLHSIPIHTKDGLVNIVVEIPAGSNQKWEVNKKTGYLEWERVNPDSLRTIKYLPYPTNYGFIPQTILSEDQGGDGDALDVFLLDNRAERGEIIQARVIGVIKIMDNGEMDDKLIAVVPNSHFGTVHNMEQLEMQFPGIIGILKTWLINYKGTGELEVQSIENQNEANQILDLARKAYINKKDV